MHELHHRLGVRRGLGETSLVALEHEAGARKVRRFQHQHLLACFRMLRPGGREVDGDARPGCRTVQHNRAGPAFRPGFPVERRLGGTEGDAGGDRFDVINHPVHDGPGLVGGRMGQRQRDDPEMARPEDSCPAPDPDLFGVVKNCPVTQTPADGRVAGGDQSGVTAVQVLAGLAPGHRVGVVHRHHADSEYGIVAERKGRLGPVPFDLA